MKSTLSTTGAWWLAKLCLGEAVVTPLKSNAFLIFSSQSDAGWEEFYDYIFPDDEANMPNFKLLQMARLWKKQNEQQHSM